VTISQKIEATAKRAALRAALVQRRYYEKRFTVSFKGDVNLVTDADLLSQEVIVATIGRAFPQHQILAEEGALGHQQPLTGPIWVIDPLDGTTNFAHGFPVFGISIAFIDRGVPQFGLAYHTLLKEMFIAHRGKGAKLNGKKIHVSKIKQLNRSLLATGFPYDRRTSNDNNLDFFCRFEVASQCVRRAGAAVIDLVNVACGRLEGFWEPKLAPWDIAAGSLIVEEAGGQISDYSGRPIHDLWCGEIIASNALIHREMVKTISSVRQDRTSTR
jgi:myo-inositol-1(or 4)-monophosphatase